MRYNIKKDGKSHPFSVKLNLITNLKIAFQLNQPHGWSTPIRCRTTKGS